MKKNIVSSEIQRERLRKHPDFQFFMQCIYKNAPDLPLTDMIVDQCLTVQYYRLTREESQALAGFFKTSRQYFPHLFNAVHLENNDLPDQDLATIVEGLNNVKTVRKFLCKDNFIGS